MKVNRIDHVGVAVNDLNESLRFYTEVLGIKSNNIKVFEIPNMVKGAMVKIGDSAIELLQFINKESPLAKRAEKTDGGIHHMALDVDSITEVMKSLKSQGVPFMTEEPRAGPAGNKIIFTHPEKAKIFIELVEY